MRFICISDSTTLMEKQTSKVNQVISRGLFEFRANVTISCNFSSDIAHLSYQNQGGQKTRSRRRTLAVTQAAYC